MRTVQDHQLFVHLRRAGVSVLLDTGGPGQPVLTYWGADLGELSQDAMASIAKGTVPPVPHAMTDDPMPRGLIPERSWGYLGRPGLSGHRSGADFAPRLLLESMTTSGQPGGHDGVEFVLVDHVAALSVRSSWRLDASGLLMADHGVTNTGQTGYELAELSVVLPVPPTATELMDFNGRWCRERSPQRRPFSFGGWTRENRRGRTGADSAFVTIAGTAGFSNRQGAVWGVHLGWSGDQVSWAEAHPDGTRVIGAAELLAPGEVSLAPGALYSTPTVFAAFSAAGLDGISDRFHQYIRARPAHVESPRPAVLNTWEAVYFDQDLDRLRRLADLAAYVGIERFVLDDGWFGNRRSDATSLGDWDVSSDVWPDGLGPLVKHVTDHGMQFGLWVEPEMLSPDSDLCRAHPEWVLGPVSPPPLARHQQVLDVANPAAFQYLFAKLDGLVKEYRIGYLKWDHNRDLIAAMHDGRAGVHAQTLAVYRLIDDLKAANPGLEIESCASGGARVDLGILARTDRVWASDCNDPLERQHIQRWTGLLLPPELVGAHIGPPTAHTTGRTQTLGFRAATALFGHLGIEWNIASATECELAVLAAVVAVYKRLRPMMHTGTVVNIDHPDLSATVSGIVARDRSVALFSYVQLTSGATERPVPIRLSGLDGDRQYRISLLDLGEASRTAQRRPPEWVSDGGLTLSGRVLESVGLALPILHPEQALLLELTAT